MPMAPCHRLPPLLGLAKGRGGEVSEAGGPNVTSKYYNASTFIIEENLSTTSGFRSGGVKV